MATVSVYNHTALRFMNGANGSGDTYKVMLLGASASFNAVHTTLAEVSGSGAYEISGHGWASGGPALANVAISVSGTSGAKFDADDVAVTVSGGDLGPFSSYVVYNATDSGSPPLVHVALDSPQEIGDGNVCGVLWAASGIVTLALA